MVVFEFINKNICIYLTGDILEELIIHNSIFKKIKVELPKTTLLIITSDKGFIMCGALNVEVYNSDKMKERGVLCASVRGVKTFDEMLNGTLYEVSDKFIEAGAYKGMSVYEALALLV